VFYKCIKLRLPDQTSELSHEAGVLGNSLPQLPSNCSASLQDAKPHEGAQKRERIRSETRGLALARLGITSRTPTAVNLRRGYTGERRWIASTIDLRCAAVRARFG
jgi:hypothetical protein